jgi:hypothetical protein
MFPGGDPRYLAWAGAPLVLLVVARLGSRLEAGTESASDSSTVPACALCAGAVLVLVFLVPLRGGGVWYSWRQPLQDPVTFKDGFYRWMRAERGEEQDLEALKSYVESCSSPTDRVVIWQAEILVYAYLNREAAILPLTSLDFFTYKQPRGEALEAQLIERLHQSPPCLVVIDSAGQGKGRELDPSVTKDAFPRLREYLFSRYRPTWHSPAGGYIVLQLSSSGS